MNRNEKQGCGCNSNCCSTEQIDETPVTKPSQESQKKTRHPSVLNIDLLAIDLETCQRCAPTAEQLRHAVRLLTPVADALGIQLILSETVIKTPEQAKTLALLSSPTIRLNGHDIAQDIRESKCESCGELTGNKAAVDCREWHYRGQVYSATPLPLLIEAIMDALLKFESHPIISPKPLQSLPENLVRYFDSIHTKSCC